VAHKCKSSQYSNMRPRYFLGRTIPEAAGIAAAAALGYIAFQLTKGMSFGGQAGKMHLLLIFAAVALPIVVGFVFFMDGAEPYPRQVVGYLRRRAVALVRSTPTRVRARAVGAPTPDGPAIDVQIKNENPQAASTLSQPPESLKHYLTSYSPTTHARAAEATDLTGRIIARLRRPRPTVEEAR